MRIFWDASWRWCQSRFAYKKDKQLTIQSADVLHCNFTVAPNGWYSYEQLLAAQTPERGTEVLPIDDEPHDSLVHVEHHCERYSKVRTCFDNFKILQHCDFFSWNILTMNWLSFERKWPKPIVKLLPWQIYCIMNIICVFSNHLK